MKLEENFPVKETLRDIASSGSLLAVLLDSDRVLRHLCFGGEMVSDCNSHVCNRVCWSHSLLLPVPGKVVEAE